MNHQGIGGAGGKQQERSEAGGPPPDNVPGEQAHHCHDAPAQVSMMHSQHAFFLVGEKHLFLVHMINSWMDCHRYQLVLKVTLDRRAHQAWLEARKAHPSEFFIVGNLASDLISLPDLQRQAKRSFQAGLWIGMPKSEGSASWPWANDPPVCSGFEVTIERVVCFRRLDFNADYPRTPSYFLFGEGDEAHLNHSPVKPPDYDHVASLSAAPDWLPAELLLAGVPVNFPRYPAVPGGHDCREAVFESNPLSDGPEVVQYGGLSPHYSIVIERTVFFGTWPFNRTNPADPMQEWRPCPAG